MDDLSAQRTLVKSPPELWAEISDLDSLAKHLGEFGEISITRLEPETTVAWEGDRIRGTVHLEPSGWGTKVTLAAELVEVVASEPEAEPAATVVPPESEPEPEPEPIVVVEPEAQAEAEPIAEPLEAKRPGFFARLFGRKATPEAAGEPEPVAEPEPEPEPVTVVEPEPEPVTVVEPGPIAIVEPDPEPEPEPVAPPEPALDGEAAQAVLVGVLDDLGAAHHRPFSRG